MKPRTVEQELKELNDASAAMVKAAQGLVNSKKLGGQAQQTFDKSVEGFKATLTASYAEKGGLPIEKVEGISEDAQKILDTIVKQTGVKAAKAAKSGGMFEFITHSASSANTTLLDIQDHIELARIGVKTHTYTLILIRTNGVLESELGDLTPTPVGTSPAQRSVRGTP